MNNHEPSVLDYIKSLITPWRGKPPAIPPAAPDTAQPPTGEPLTESLAKLEAPQMTMSSIEAVTPPLSSTPPVQPVTQLDITHTQPEFAVSEASETPLSLPTAETLSAGFPWRAFLAIGLVLIAQFSLEPRPVRDWMMGAVLYFIAAMLIILANWKGDWSITPYASVRQHIESFTVRHWGALLAVPVAVVAFVAFGGNRFTSLNLTLWLTSLALMIWAFWLGKLQILGWLKKLWTALRKKEWSLKISGWTLLVLAVIIMIAFFHLYLLDTIPNEMVSDHAEKLLDTMDINNGQHSVFFPRNTGREPVYIYLTAWIIQYFNTGYTFLSMKISALIGLLITYIYMYLLGKEISNKWVGLLTVIFAGFAYWPNVFTRFGLRISFYPLFVAITLYYLIRGLRSSNRNDFILAGLGLGFGLMGYTPFRIMPFVVLIAFGLFLLHRQSSGKRVQAILWLGILVLISVLVFIPLFRYWQEYPEMFSFRAFTRLGSTERPLPGPAMQIFFSNLWRAMTMYAWDDGEIWVHSIPHRPAVDAISGALFYAGLLLLFLRYLKKWHWLDLFLILSVPMLMMPSILSLAFPAENPALNRVAGAIVPVFLIIGMSFEGILSSIKTRLAAPWGGRLAGIMGILLVIWSASLNYNLLFKQYGNLYAMSSWNTSEMGQTIQSFGELYGETDTAWVVAFPHWVDTRLVGMHAGVPARDFAIWPEQLTNTLLDPRPKMFLVNPQDLVGLQTLEQLYPLGSGVVFRSKVAKDYIIYMVPAADNSAQSLQATPTPQP